jgi:hypothetical protein
MTVLHRHQASLAAAFAAALAFGGSASADCADVSLVLAIDTSGSVDAPEFELQKAGYARAFRDDEVLAALRSAGTVDVAAVFWGDEAAPVGLVEWHRIGSRADAADFASRVAEEPRITSGNTGIGRGLWAALDLLAVHGCAARRIVNVSGDGRESLDPKAHSFISAAAARARAEAEGVTINALAITLEDEGLADWYTDRVITGPDAFVMQVAGYDSFAEAIARKLAREISTMAIASVERSNGPVPWPTAALQPGKHAVWID